MSQHDMTVDNGAGLAVRASLNSALQALASQSSGASAPSPTFPAQVWADTGTGRLKQRNAANSAWIDKGAIDGAMAPLDSPVFTTLVQVPNAVLANQAAAFGQITGVVGQARNVKMSVTAVSASATLTADEVIVESALGGLRYCLSTFSKSVNLATTGIGGMDTGTAPASGFVALYAIYNPTTGVSALLAINAASTTAPEVYGGANMPSGYTASALLAVWPTNASSQFVAGLLQDRAFSYDSAVTVLTTNSAAGTTTSLSVSGALPRNAKTSSGMLSISTTSGAAGAGSLYLFLGSSSPAAISSAVGAVANVFSQQTPYALMPVLTPQTLYYQASGPATPTFRIYITGYTI